MQPAHAYAQAHYGQLQRCSSVKPDPAYNDRCYAVERRQDLYFVSNTHPIHHQRVHRALSSQSRDLLPPVLVTLTDKAGIRTRGCFSSIQKTKLHRRKARPSSIHAWTLLVINGMACRLASCAEINAPRPVLYCKYSHKFA